MVHFTAGQVAEITGGSLLCGDPDTVIDNICYDSRQVKEGSLFVPIKGVNTDPHKFIEDCFKKGAAASLTEYDAPEGAEKPYIKVNNTLPALQRLASFYRQSMDVKIIGVTGSVGKTSTKEMIAAALSKGLDVMKTQGNKNSQIGMPMTMFDIEPHNRAAVIEMGMSEFGEMERLCDVARPQMAVMTNIGVAHIENLGTQENIMSEKLKITNHFTEDSILFLNGDDKLLRTLHGKQKFRTVTFGLSQDNDFYADNIVTEGFCTRFVCHSGNEAVELKIPALGVHSIVNALAAFAVGRAMGLSDDIIAEGLLTYKNAPMRQQIHRCGDIILIDDSYNASPDAAIASIDVLKSVSEGTSIAVLADMLELGDKSEEEHYRVGKHAAQAGVDILLAVGPLSRATAKGAAENGCTAAEVFDTNPQAYQRLEELAAAGCSILVKGSRGMHTDEIVKSFLAAHPE